MHNHKNNKMAIVMGGHVQSLGIVRALGRAGFKTAVWDQTSYNIARHSKYCSRFEEVSNNDLLEKLKAPATIDAYKSALVFPSNDEHVEILSNNLTELSEHYRPATDRWEVIEKCFNKRLTYQVATECRIPVADTRFPNSVEEVDKLSHEIDYPCIIKPAVMYRFYRSFKTKVFICHDAGELLVNYRKAIQVIPKDEIIIQDVIPGSSQEQYSVGCLFNRTGPLASLAARRLRQHPIDFGNATTYAETVDEPDLVEMAHTLLRKINYKGICEVEFKRDPRDGMFKFLEINPRTWKWHSIAETANVPFIENYTKILTNEVPGNHDGWEDASWSHYITDVPVILRMIARNIYKKPKKKCHVRAVLQSDDLKPALFEMIYLPYLIKSR